MCLIDPPPPLAHISLETLAAERVELYAHAPPPGRPIPIEGAPFPVDDTIPGGGGVAEAVMQIRLHHAGGN